jgi:transposase
MAVRHALGRWKALLRYADDGRIEIDHNATEQALRTVALGRKDYLFAGSHVGGGRAAAIYTLIGTASSMVLNPQRTCATCHRASPLLSCLRNARGD